MELLEGVVLFAANTARSQAYAQALKHNQFATSAAVILSGSGLPESSARHISSSFVATDPWIEEDMSIPDFSIPLAETCSEISDAVYQVRATTVNDDINVIELLKKLQPSLVIYSGFGGQIVGDAALDTAPFLHAHSGWLPEYRGSTTLYYSLLRENRCAVSAILLENEIDTGVIVARKHFPAPSYGTDLDYLYDSAIRAHVIVHALKDWKVGRRFSVQERQSPAVGDTYYIIHPLLKHMAICSTMQ